MTKTPKQDMWQAICEAAGMAQDTRVDVAATETAQSRIDEKRRALELEGDDDSAQECGRLMALVMACAHFRAAHTLAERQARVAHLEALEKAEGATIAKVTDPDLRAARDAGLEAFRGVLADAQAAEAAAASDTCILEGMADADPADPETWPQAMRERAAEWMRQQLSIDRTAERARRAFGLPAVGV